MWFPSRTVNNRHGLLPSTVTREMQRTGLHMPFYIAFIDLTKAFDLVSRDGLFKVLPKISCPPKLQSMIASFHTDTKGTVLLGAIRNSQRRQTRLRSCSNQCLIQDKISTSPSPTDRRAVVTPRGRHIGRYLYLIILPLLIILLSLKSNFIIL